MTAPNYQVTRINLGADGQLPIERGFGYLHVVAFQNAAGELVYEGQINVRLTRNDTDQIPLYQNGKVALDKADRGLITWAAQPGRFALVALAANARDVVFDTPALQPPPRLRLGSSNYINYATSNLGVTILSGASNVRGVLITSLSLRASAAGNRSVLQFAGTDLLAGFDPSGQIMFPNIFVPPGISIGAYSNDSAGFVALTYEVF